MDGGSDGSGGAGAADVHAVILCLLVYLFVCHEP